MTFEQFCEAIGRETTNFLKKFQYSGRESKDSFWVKVNQGMMSWSNKYASTPYNLLANNIIKAVWETIEMDTASKESS